MPSSSSDDSPTTSLPTIIRVLIVFTVLSMSVFLVLSINSPLFTPQESLSPLCDNGGVPCDYVHTPYCNAQKQCVECFRDDHCLNGQCVDGLCQLYSCATSTDCIGALICTNGVCTSTPSTAPASTTLTTCSATQPCSEGFYCKNEIQTACSQGFVVGYLSGCPHRSLLGHLRTTSDFGMRRDNCWRFQGC